jgi:hypothetical protein
VGSAQETRARHVEVERYALDSIAADHREHVNRPSRPAAAGSFASRGVPASRAPDVEIRTYFVPPVDPGARRLAPGVGVRRVEPHTSRLPRPLAFVLGLLRRETR